MKLRFTSRWMKMAKTYFQGSYIILIYHFLSLNNYLILLSLNNEQYTKLL